jgi:hypothetical protein
MITQGLIAVVARLVREMPRNPGIIELQQELKAALEVQSNTLDKPTIKFPFDKKTYQRDLMRKRRAAEKANGTQGR